MISASPISKLLSILTRMLFAVVVAGGALATVGSLPVDVEEIAEEAEDERVVEAPTVQARTMRRVRVGSAPFMRHREQREAPREIAPATAIVSVQRSWMLPRRLAAGDDDDDDGDSLS